MIRWLSLAAAVFLAVLGVSPVAAHTRSESHSSWVVDGRVVNLSFTVSDIEAQRITPDGTPPDDGRLIAYLAAREGVSANGIRCRASKPPRAVAAATGFRRIEFGFDCPGTDQLVLHSGAFFELVPTHVNLAQIQSGGGFIEQVLTADSPDMAMGEDGEGLQNAGFVQFVEMGVMHIFTGIDHMSFLLGLVLISRQFRDLAFVVTGFTLGHSLTLALAVTGILRPHAEFIDALVALTIMLIGVENVAVATGRPVLIAAWAGGALAVIAALRLLGIGLLPPLLLIGTALFAASYLLVSGQLRDAARLRLVVTLVFGLIHGFGFAADLLETKIPAARLAELLVGFNLGVEIGQLTIVSLLAGSVWLLARWRLALPRPLVVDGLASFLVALGTYWFIARSF